MQHQMYKHSAFGLILISTIVSSEAYSAEDPSIERDFRYCEDILVDDVTEMAFGDQGQPFTGKVKCFSDIERKHLRTERVFDEGIPIGTHHCFWKGVVTYSIIYKNGKRHKYASKFLEKKYSRKNEDGKGIKLGFIYMVPGDYRELSCTDENSQVNRCMKGGWSHCF